MKESESVFIGLIRAGGMAISSDGTIFWVKEGAPTTRAEHRTSVGYLQVRKMVDGHRYHVGAHRIVWIWFNGEIPDGMVPNHKNGIKDDNRPSNLEIVTYSENMAHAHRTGLKDQRGEKNPAAKLTDRQVAEIRLAYAEGGFTQAGLAKKYGVTFQTISKVVRGDRRSSQPGETRDYTGRRKHENVERDPITQRFVKHAAGRLLDGITHDGYPEVNHG